MEQFVIETDMKFTQRNLKKVNSMSVFVLVICRLNYGIFWYMNLKVKTLIFRENELDFTKKSMCIVIRYQLYLFNQKTISHDLYQSRNRCLQVHSTAVESENPRIQDRRYVLAGSQRGKILSWRIWQHIVLLCLRLAPIDIRVVFTFQCIIIYNTSLLKRCLLYI